jgi:hypothetical protein
MSLAQANRSYRNAGIGNLFLFPAPTADPGTDSTTRVKGIFALMYSDDGRKTLKGGVTPWGTHDSGGVEFDVKPRILTYDFGDGSPDDKAQIGVEEATVKLAINDADAAHWADVWGINAADLIAVAATTGKAGRIAALMGNPNSGANYIAIYQQPSLAFPGQFDHFVWPRVSFLTEPKIKFSPKDKVKIDITLQAKGDLFLKATDGSPVFGFPEYASAAPLP